MMHMMLHYFNHIHILRHKPGQYLPHQLIIRFPFCLEPGFPELRLIMSPALVVSFSISKVSLWVRDSGETSLYLQYAVCMSVYRKHH